MRAVNLVTGDLTTVPGSVVRAPPTCTRFCQATPHWILDRARPVVPLVRKAVVQPCGHSTPTTPSRM